MQKITFPILNLELNVNKVAINIFNIDIYWYAIIIVASIILATIMLKKKDGLFGIKYNNIIDLLIILLPISFISARIYYVIFSLDQYENILQIINIKDGGLAIYGGIIGGVITIYFFCKKYNIQILNLLDYIVPQIAFAQSLGRWGNFLNVEAYGTQTNLPWKMGIIENGQLIFVHPTFLYESICTLIIFIILNKKTKNRKFKGEITYLYVIMYSFCRIFIEGLRIDSLMLKNIRISQILSVILFSTFCIMLSKKIKKSRIIQKNKI